MNHRLILHLTGTILAGESVCMLLPMAVALYCREDPRPFVYSAAFLAALSLPLSRFRGDGLFYAGDGYSSAGFIWFLVSALGALPFWFSGYFSSYTDCLFESVSGFTTTGASILTQVENLPRGILFWRSLTHWLGGMGVLTLAVALVPFLGGRALSLMRAESPGPVLRKTVPKLSRFAGLLFLVYLALTLLELLFLLRCSLPLFDSVTLALSTAGTGGFSVRNRSVGAYGNPAAETVISVFTLFFSVNLSLYLYLLKGRVRQVLRSDELRFFLGMVLAGTAFVSLNIRPFYVTAAETVHHAFFQVTTICSTTGFSSADFDQWPAFSRVLLVLLMLCGACSGSTGGGIKCARILVLLKSAAREIRQAVHPRAVRTVKLDGRVLEESAVCSIATFISLYFVIIFCAALILSLDGFAFGTTLTAVIACIGNIGPGLELVGPMGNYSLFSPFSKLVLSLCMVIGRLEILPVLVLFGRAARQRH